MQQFNNSTTKRYPVCLTIAGSDSGGGAGIQADLKTISALGVYGMSAITAITVQNTLGVSNVFPIPAQTVGGQIEAVLSDIGCDAVKIGMLHNAACVDEVIKAFNRFQPRNIVLDPVMVSTSGHKLIEEETVELIKTGLFPYASLITPNTDEATLLTGIRIVDNDSMLKAGEQLLSCGCCAVLMKGGHLEGAEMNDLLLMQGCAPLLLSSPRIDTKNTHGTGCSLSSAIASYLALGETLPEAVKQGKHYITAAIEAGADISTGGGHGPVNHFFDPKRLIPFNIEE